MHIFHILRIPVHGFVYLFFFHGFLRLRTEFEVQRHGRPTVVQDSSLTIEIRKNTPLLLVSIYGVVVTSTKPLIRSRSGSLRLQDVSENGKGSQEGLLTDTFTTEIFLVKRCTFRMHTLRLQFFGSSGETSCSEDGVGGKLGLLFHHDVRLGTEPDHGISFVFDLEESGYPLVEFGVVVATRSRESMVITVGLDL